ncbi:MAG: geranylgeranylglyceryl/heptaprenylglyceryl phosphate synthase, partial [Candidatus Nitrosotenuis sp.]|nr:geranylgeranylglyceryl/heptaprenylglyceryl phosphate synthase [Candidatus Nitrosotenuis sp.]
MGKVEQYLQATRKKKGALLFVLIDSEVSKIKESIKLAREVEKTGASAILVGGSSAIDQLEMAQV